MVQSNKGEGIMLDDLDNILNSIDLEEEKLEIDEEFKEDWFCDDCEHGPMMDSDSHCTRCGAKHKYSQPEELTGWEDEDIEAEVEEIW